MKNIETKIESNKFNWYDIKTIKGRIILYSITMILFMAGTVAISSYLLNKSHEKTEQVVNLRLPNATTSSRLEARFIETALLVRHIMLTQKDEFEEQRKKTWEVYVNKDIEFLNAQKIKFTNPKNIALVDSINNNFLTVRKLQDKISELIFASKKNLNDKLLDSLNLQQKKAQLSLLAEITPLFKNTRRMIGELAASQKELLVKDIEYVQESAKNQKSANYILLLIAVFVALIISAWIVKSILTPIANLHELMLKLSKGYLPGNIKAENNEIGEMVKASNTLVNGLRVTTNFANEIGNGSFESDFTPLSEEDVLGKSLLTMRDNLKTAALEEQKRAWATEGMAKFGEILRATDDGFSVLADNIISNLVKYLNANQGGLFVVNDSNISDKHLELIACYAWNKKKYINMRVEEGEGLVGQAWQENDILYITDVPTDFVRITSGLGDANPKSFLIIPLSVNDETYGVIEIASFHSFEEHQREFVKKLAESIAATLSTTKINERTKALLEQSQQQTEEMRAQEEEMRQNMEEMQATQEEMERKEMEMKKMMEQTEEQGEELKQSLEEMKATQEEIDKISQEQTTQLEIINNVAIVSKTDLRGNIIYVNDLFCKYAKYSREELMGKPHNIVRHPDMPAEAFVDLWKTISSGKIWKGEVKNKAKDGTHYWVDATISPVLDNRGKPREYMAVRYLISDFKNSIDHLNKTVAEMEKQSAQQFGMEMRIHELEQELIKVKGK